LESIKKNNHYFEGSKYFANKLVNNHHVALGKKQLLFSELAQSYRAVGDAYLELAILSFKKKGVVK